MADHVAKISGEDRLRWWCPGCEDTHLIPVKPYDPTGWDFNNDFDAPTVSPSVLVYAHDRMPPRKSQPQCHTFIRDGRIEFLSDCTHHLAGQTVPMVSVKS